MKFVEFKVGQVLEAGSYQLDESAIIEYATRYDPQPFHTDEEAAKNSQWRGIIASGFHTCAIAMRLIADSILCDSGSCGSPGLEFVKWPAPVYGGDTLRLKVHVLDVRNSKSGTYGVVRWRWQLVNQRDILVLELVATSLFQRSRGLPLCDEHDA
jgi:acyl dehydratase